MKKILRSMFAMLFAFVCISSAQAASIENTRTVQGELYTFIENEQLDCIYSLIDTVDGHRYIVRDFVAPRGSECTIVFDTHGTDDEADDTILYIFTLWTNTEGDKENV